MTIAPVGPEAFVLRAKQAPSDSAAPPSRPVAAQRGFAKALEALGREMDRGERLVGRALHARGELDAGQLIALQAGIYRYSEVVEITAKLVDRAGNAIRTTLQSSG